MTSQEALARLLVNPEDADARACIEELAKQSVEEEQRQKEAEEAARIEAERLARKRATDKYEILPARNKSMTTSNGLYRIRALRDFADVKKGQEGGFVQSEANLSQKGDCWLYSGNCHGNAQISGNAKVKNSEIYGNAQVSGNAEVFFSYVSGNAKVSGKAMLYRMSVRGDAEITGNVKIGTSSYKIGRLEMERGKVEGDFELDAEGSFFSKVGDCPWRTK